MKRKEPNRSATARISKAIGFFEQAVGVDPSYGLAYTGLADSYCVLGLYGFLPSKAAFSKARMYVERALALDEQFAEAHASLGFIRLFHDWDWDGAERELKRALELKPDYIEGHCWYGLLLSYVGRQDEAYAVMRRALDLDPLSPYARALYGVVLRFGRRYEEATLEVQKALDCDPDYVFALFLQGIVLCERSLYDEGIASLHKAVSLSNRAPVCLCVLGSYCAGAGKKGESEAILKELLDRSQREYVAPLFIAWPYIDNKDKAFECLEKAYQERDGFLAEIKVSEGYDPFRSDPRFDDLLRRMNFPE